MKGRLLLVNRLSVVFFPLLAFAGFLFAFFSVDVANAAVNGPGWFKTTNSQALPLDFPGPSETPEGPPPPRSIASDADQTSVQITTTQSSGITPLSLTTPPSTTTVTPEISELARALRYDPKLIFEYVQNNIAYTPYFGSLKGATSTYLDKRGNDFDQASLMIALLKVAETATGQTFSPQFVKRREWVAGYWLYDLLGVSWDANAILNTLGGAGIPVYGYEFDYYYYDYLFEIDWVYVKATIDGRDYQFDPAFKEHTYTAKINLGSSMGYNRADLLSAAGGIIGADYVQSLNEGSLNSKLEFYAGTLAGNLRNQYPNKSVEEIIGGREIIPYTLSQYTPFYLYPNDILWDEIPPDYMAKLQISHVDISETLYTPQIAGKRLTMTYEGGDLHPVLKLDGIEIATSNGTSQDSNEMLVSIIHPYLFCDRDTGIVERSDRADQLNVPFPLKRDSTYAIISEFGGTSTAVIANRQKVLQANIDSSGSSSEPVLGETLNLMGLSYIKEVRQAQELLDRVSNTVNIRHHMLGIMAQEAGYYVDLKAYIVTPISIYGQVADQDANFKASMYSVSALEHGILEQLMGLNNPGVSTMKLFQIANADGNKFFFADSNNYGPPDSPDPSHIRNRINYSDYDIDTTFQGLINDGHTLILPESGFLVSGQWRGKGFISRHTEKKGIGMIIGGGFNGGYSSNPGTVEAPAVNEVVVAHQTTTISPESVISHPTQIPTPVSQDPVDLAGGAFLHDHTDLALGGAAPRGLAFSRSYNSGKNQEDIGLGFGWTHGYHIQLDETSHADPALGSRQPVDAAAMIVAMYATFDLMKNQDDLQGCIVSSLVNKWAIDRLLDNSVTVTLGKKVLEYVKLPDGTFAGPPGVTTELIDNGNGTFSLRERFGTRIDFNAADKISQWTEVDGYAMAFTYNADNTVVTDSSNRTLTLQYTGDRISSVSDSTGRSVSFGYDAEGNLTTYTDPEQKIWSYGYNPAGKHLMTSLTKPIDGMTSITTATNSYDSLGRVKSQTVPRLYENGTPYNSTYNFYFSGFRNIEEDPAGNKSIYYFDHNGRSIGEEHAGLNDLTERFYDGQNHIIYESDPRGNQTWFTYDGYNNLVKIKNEKLEETTYTYDNPVLPLSSVTDYLGNRVDYHYDAEFRRDWAKVYPSETETITTLVSYYLDGLHDGLPATSTDGRGTVSNFTYDAYGNPDRAGVGTHPQVDYDYDARGWLTKVIDQENVNTAEKAHTYFEYNNLGQVTLKRTPISKSESRDTVYTYYDDGSILTKKDRKNNTITYTYTPSGNFRTITYQDNSSVVFNYNSLDQITSIKNYAPTGSLVNETLYTAYDAAGRLLSVTDPHDFIVSYAYNEAGNIKEITYPSSDIFVRKLTYRYDELNRLQYVDNWLSQTAQYVYDGAGRLDHVINFNGTKTFYGYDNANRMTSLENVQANETTVIASYNYPELDGNGNRKTIDEVAPIPQAVIAQTTSYTYNDVKNRLEYAGPTFFTFDDEGQITAKGSTTYAFDFEHRLTGVNGADAIQYTYDAIGNRLEKTVNGQITRYIYDQLGNLLAEADSNNILRYYIHGKGLLAMITPGDGATYCYHFDGSGNTVAMTEDMGDVVNAYAYEPFGVITNQSETVSHSFKFAGQVGIMAEPNGFYYMRARYYDPEVGRFISEDPIGFDGGSLNLYAYVQNNPIMFSDPSGLRWFGGGDDGWSLGRRRSIIPPGGTIGAWLETEVAAMETMSLIHDPLVDALVPELGDGRFATAVEGTVDYLVNIPTMPLAYGAAVAYESANSFVDAVTGTYNFITGGACNK